MRLLWTPRWLLIHAGVVVLVVGFLGLCWWQVSRAEAGNLLSFGYAIEWPAFAAFLIYVWIKEMRRVTRPDATGEAAPAEPAEPDAVPAVAGAAARRVTRQRARSGPAYEDGDDDALAAYNHYLTWLNAHPDASSGDYPGPPGNEEEK